MLILNFLQTSHVIYKAILSVQSNFFHAQTAYCSKKTERVLSISVIVVIAFLFPLSQYYFLIVSIFCVQFRFVLFVIRKLTRDIQFRFCCLINVPSQSDIQSKEKFPSNLSIAEPLAVPCPDIVLVASMISTLMYRYNYEMKFVNLVRYGLFSLSYCQVVISLQFPFDFNASSQNLMLRFPFLFTSYTKAYAYSYVKEN